jgi:photosystem II stability/assembly factor-like uncharacterized protein
MKTFIILGILLLFSSVTFAQWAILSPAPTDKKLFSVCFPEPETGYLAGRNGVLFKTEDGGTNWIALESGTDMDLTSVYFMDAGTGVVSTASMDGGRILKTTDGGSTWISKFHSSGNWINDLFFVNATVGYAVGNSPDNITKVIQKTTDGGETWNMLLSPVNDDLLSCFFTDANTGYAVGSACKVLKTIDGGLNWTVSSPSWQTLTDVFFTDQNTGYIVGTIGCIMKTTDAGENWTVLPSVTVKDLYSVVFTSENNGYIVGQDGTILMTADAGLHWTISVSGTSLNLWDVYFNNESTGYIVGDDGLILKTTNAGALGMSESELSKGYVTVYPNPAKRLINIEFNDQLSSDVKVTISGINGQLLWEKEFGPAEKIQVDISFLPRGAYLLRSETQAGVEVTKVIL